MKTLKITLFLATALTFACQKEVQPSYDMETRIDSPQAYLAEESYTDNEPVCYLADIDFSLWTKIESLDDRFNACDISKDKAKTMTTDALVRSILHYPLNYIIFAYNNPLDAVHIVLEHSNLHQELMARTDAAEIILKYFREADINISATYSSFDKTYQKINYADEIFLEYLIGSGMVRGFDNQYISKQLLNVAKVKAKERILDSDTFSEYSIRPLNSIIYREVPSYVSSSSMDSYIYTLFGQRLSVISPQELSAYEIYILTHTFINQYPDAEMIRPASATYNCHSYAWYDQSENNHYWLQRSSPSGNLQLDRYWTDDYYYSTTEVNAEKVYYADGDHSAIVLPTGWYVSKWGQGPLMKHAPNYGPYTQTNKQYYCHRTNLPYDITFSIIGATTINLNTVQNYSLPHEYHNMTLSWSAEPLSGVPGTCQCTMNSNGSCSFSANTPGAYYLYLQGYRNGNLLIAGYSIIIVYGI